MMPSVISSLGWMIFTMLCFAVCVWLGAYVAFNRGDPDAAWLLSITLSATGAWIGSHKIRSVP